ncbi:MAG: arylsulfatase [Pirellulales bacterium]
MPATARKLSLSYAYHSRGPWQHGLIVLIMIAAVTQWPILKNKTALSADLPRRPNIIFILADDLGYGDLGCYGQQKIKTPRLDRLAAEGMRFTQHYAGCAVCAPSRCVLMTGRHPGHAYIRDNKDPVQPGVPRPVKGQIPIPDDALTLAEQFHANGYATAGCGKWGLGGHQSTGDPLRQGFDHFFGYLDQWHAHNFYPTFIWNDGQRLPLNNAEIDAHQKLPADADPQDPQSYTPYIGEDYVPDRVSERALAFIRENRERPFFLYVPTAVPHLALQVPPDSLAEYQGQWEDPPYLGDRGYTPHFTPRAAYAAMITRMDRDVGRILDLVRELNLDERTIVVFTSDNGPAPDRVGGTDGDFFASSGELRGQKGSLYEGGIRVPCLVRWTGQIAAGTASDRVTGFEDWFTTLLELTGHDSSATPDTDGFSFAPTLLNREQPPRDFLYREFASYGGQQSVRVGPWKGVRQNLLPRGKNVQPTLNVELYNLDSDPGESRDVAAHHPRVVAQMEQLMREQHVPSAEFPIGPLDEASRRP